MEQLTGSTASWRGRAPATLFVEVVRELSEDDLILRSATSVGSEARPLIKLRYQHHRLAQLIAGGMKDGEASLVTGYSISRISILKQSPAFQELLSHYIGVNKEVFADLQGRMAGFALDTLDELQDRLEEQPKDFSNKELLAALQLTNDRGGNSPVNKTQHTHIVLTADEINKIRNEVKAIENGRIIEAKALENNPGAEVGEAVLLPAESIIPEQEAQGLESKGQDI